MIDRHLYGILTAVKVGLYRNDGYVQHDIYGYRYLLIYENNATQGVIPMPVQVLEGNQFH